MCNDISTDWLFRIGRKHGSPVDLCNNLIGDDNGHAKLKQQ